MWIHVMFELPMETRVAKKTYAALECIVTYCVIFITLSHNFILANSVSDINIGALTNKSNIVVVGKDITKVMCNPFRFERPNILCAYSIQSVEFIKGGPTRASTNVFVDMLRSTRTNPNLAKPDDSDPNTQYIFFLNTDSTTSYGSYNIKPSAKQWFAPFTKENMEKVRQSIILPEEWGKEAWGLRMGIRTAKQKYNIMPLEPIIIELFIKNDSNEPISIPQHRTKWNYYPYTYFFLDNYNRTGTATIEKPPGRMGSKKMPDINLKPGQIYIDTIRLDSWGWNSANGQSPFRAKSKWKLQAKYLFNKDKNLRIESQVMTIRFD